MIFPTNQLPYILSLFLISTLNQIILLFKYIIKIIFFTTTLYMSFFKTQLFLNLPPKINIVVKTKKTFNQINYKKVRKLIKMKLSLKYDLYQ